MYTFPDLEPVCCSMSSSNFCFLTCIQISQEADKVVWYSHLFQNFPQFIVIYTAKGFGICREPVRHSTRDKGHEEGGSAYAKAGSSLRSPPGYSRAFSPPKKQSLPTLLLCALTSDFTGGCPLPPSLSLCQRVNL